MLLREVEYAKPASVAEALSILAGSDGARALAGGQTLINVMKARVASPDLLVDLNGLPLQGDDVARLSESTDGWVAALQLVSCRCATRPIPPR